MGPQLEPEWRWGAEAEPPAAPPAAPTLSPPGAAPEPPALPPRRRWRRLRLAVWAFTILFGLLFAWLLWTAPLTRVLTPAPRPSLVFLASDGTPFARLGGARDAPVDARALPKHISGAFVAIEDRRFRSHWGVDPRGIARAMVANLRAGHGVEGGSTLTQQLAKTAFLSPERSLRRKLQEVLVAFWLEAWLTKDEILSRYLSTVYFGDGVYGLRAAAHHYFNRSPERLSVAQAAMLAGLMKAPTRLAPTHNLAGARARARLVIAAMADTGVITPAQARAAAPAQLSIGRVDLPSGSYFSDWIAPVASDLFAGESGATRVATTLDRRLQSAAERAVRSALAGGAAGAGQAALVAMRRDGRVVAMVGGRDYAKSPFNRAVQARRQPGSAFKLPVYLAALRSGLTPDSLVEDTPLTIGSWSPRNADGTYRGAIPLREAFARSSNVAAVRLAERVGRGQVVQAARDLGIRSPLADDPSLALGTSGVTLLELTSAYAGIAAGAYPVVPRGLADVTPGWKQRLGLDRTAVPGATRDEMLDLLHAAATTGTGRAAALAIPTYGKTGTTQDHRDALFVGFAGDLVVGVWVGNDDYKPMRGVTGGGLPARIWHAFMLRAIPAVPKPRKRELLDWLPNFIREAVGAAREDGPDAVLDIANGVGAALDYIDDRKQ